MKSQCDNCDWVGTPGIELGEVPDLYQRIEPGGIVPSGECPKCGALCYPKTTKPKPLRVLIEVLGGVAEVTQCPSGVEVTIRDLDNEKCGKSNCFSRSPKNESAERRALPPRRQRNRKHYEKQT